VYLSSFHISPETARSYVDALNSHRPALFTGYAGAFYNLAKVCLAESLALEYRPKAIVLVGERVTPEMAKTISSAFGARVWEEYGCVENCLLATQCEAGGLHVSSDVGIVEILDEDDRPVGPGVEGRVVCTSLLNGVQPLVRYELGDVAVWRKDKCPCGRDQFPLIGEVVGRIGDGLVTPDGRFVDKVHTIFTGVEHIHRGQIVQESLDKIVLNVVPAPGFSEVDRLTLVRRIAERIGAVQIELRLIPEIPTTRAGKFKMVISHLPDKVRKENTVGDGNAPSSQDLLQGSVS
jgi:phenylacetate-CoA ligase